MVEGVQQGITRFMGSITRDGHSSTLFPIIPYHNRLNDLISSNARQANRWLPGRVTLKGSSGGQREQESWAGILLQGTKMETSKERPFCYVKQSLVWASWSPLGPTSCDLQCAKKHSAYKNWRDHMTCLRGGIRAQKRGGGGLEVHQPPMMYGADIPHWERELAGHLRCMLGDFTYQRGDVLPHVFVRVFEAGQRSREDLCLYHHLGQIHRVLADLPKGWEDLALEARLGHFRWPRQNSGSILQHLQDSSPLMPLKFSRILNKSNTSKCVCLNDPLWHLFRAVCNL